MSKILLIAVLLAAPALADEFDLTKLDRTIRRTPNWTSHTPRFALLVVSAEKRVWLVVVDDDLYADIDGDGDLTTPDEKFALINPETRRHGWRVPDLCDSDGKPVVTGITVRPDTNRGAAPGSMFVSFEVAGRRRASVRPRFGDTPAEAPVIHPTGPVRLRARAKPLLFFGRDSEGKRLVRSGLQVTGECYVEGLGYGVAFLTATPDLDCTLEIPLVDGETAVQKMRLTYFTDWGWYRSNNATLPEDASKGKVRITVSVPEPADGSRVPEPFVFEQEINRR
jgi:hypothetical protein